MAYLIETMRKNAPKRGIEFTIGGLAACCSGVFTNPLELIKTRMQLQGEQQIKGQYEAVYKNVFHAAYVIAKEEGIMGLQRGLGASLVFLYTLNSIRLGTYQILQKKGFMNDENGNILFYKSVLIGGMSGALGAFVASPFFLTKTYAQTKTPKGKAFGYQHEYEGMWKTLVRVYKQRGVKNGLYKGCVSSLPRAFMGSTSQLTSFAYCKEMLNKYEYFQQSKFMKAFVASMIGGVVVTAIMLPFDVISTRIYNQGVDEFGRGLLYDGYIDCVVKIYKIEGLSGFYKGLGPSYLRMGPHTVLSLIFWEQFTMFYDNFTSIQE